MPYTLYVFGSNGEGQLGIPAQDIISIPTVASSWPSEETISTLGSGDNHTLFLTASGQVLAAGDNTKGQLGHTIEDKRIERIEKLYGSMHFAAATCESSAYITNTTRYGGIQEAALITEGTSHWGELGLSEESSTLGHSRESRQSLPSAVIDFAAGTWHYTALLSNGQTYGWGKSRHEQLGSKLSDQKKITVPTKIEEDIPFTPVKVVCGKDFTYIASSAQEGKHRLLGRDKNNLRTSMPSHIKGWKQIGASWNAIFVLFEDGKLAAWGKEDMWKLVPDELPLIDSIAVGSEHVLAVTREGKLISWGWGKHGNCGDLRGLGEKVENDMVNGFWNEIGVEGKIESVGAGFCTSFVLVDADGR
ncbi:RCC1/BLIP-II [Massarina eburnea CBS 473.64]|uniref:RCC1/BLIP-II n=1 Tax=Massarina eburnea CBS 473.64 TaxID=1395130 RepID=A0A6A6SAP0_9PLEO|nr:RCC1/BLIP-II [Massarina eburnea CBS 473.64]